MSDSVYIHFTNAASPRFEARYSLEGLHFDEVLYTPGLRMASHTHVAAFLDLCLTGTIQEFWEKQTFVRGAATLNFLPAGAPHGSHFPEDVKTFQIVLTPAWLERFRQAGALLETPLYFQNGLPIWIAMRIYREFQQQDNLTPLVLEGMLLELLAEMSRQSSNSTKNDCPRWLRQAQDFLHAHFTEGVSMDGLAAAVGVHPSHLMRGFRQHYRCTIGDYVRRLRVEYACHLLAASDSSPSQIAFAVGFADQSHFNRTFKGFTGMTPTEFQRVSGRASRRQEVLLSSKTDSPLV